MVKALGSKVVKALATVAAVSLVLGLAGVVSAGLLTSLADNVPGLALLRDGTRYLGGLALFESLAFGFGAVMMLLGFGLITARSRHWRTSIDGRDPVVRPSIALA